LSDSSVAKEKEVMARTNRNLALLRSYPLEKQNASEKLSTHLLDGFLQTIVDGEKFQFHNYPVNQLFGCRTRSRLSWRTRTGCCGRATRAITSSGSRRLR